MFVRGIVGVALALAVVTAPGCGTSRHCPLGPCPLADLFEKDAAGRAASLLGAASARPVVSTTEAPIAATATVAQAARRCLR